MTSKNLTYSTQQEEKETYKNYETCEEEDTKKEETSLEFLQQNYGDCTDSDDSDSDEEYIPDLLRSPEFKKQLRSETNKPKTTENNNNKTFDIDLFFNRLKTETKDEDDDDGRVEIEIVKKKIKRKRGEEPQFKKK